MKIAVAVAQFHVGTTAEYVHAALRELGHDPELLDAPGLYRAAKEDLHSLYLCVDSGEPLPLTPLAAHPQVLRRLAFWFIDYRHNKNRTTRVPNDFENARFVHDHGGWIFQAQREDAEECGRQGITRCSWLPVAADTTVWSDLPREEKQFELCFVGSLWDETRVEALRTIQRAGIKLGFFGHRALWKADAARAIRRSQIAFNISSFYGTPIGFDINMRFFESLSCGVPLITNEVPSLGAIGAGEFVRCYRSLEEIVPVVRASLQDDAFLHSGSTARRFIEQHHTYQVRMGEMLKDATAHLEIN